MYTFQDILIIISSIAGFLALMIYILRLHTLQIKDQIKSVDDKLTQHILLNDNRVSSLSDYIMSTNRRIDSHFITKHF